MFDFLSAGDQGCVQDGGIFDFIHGFLGLFDDTLQALALLSLGVLVEFFEDLLQALDVAPGLFQMLLKPLLQFGGRGGLDHLGQGLEDLIFRAVQILEFRNVEVL